MKIIKHLTWAALAAMLLVHTSTARADDQGPQHITVKVCWVEDDGPFGKHWTGTVDGDCGIGSVVFNYLSILPGKAIWRYSGEYTVITPGCSFKTVGAGNIDVRTGRLVWNGTVTEGEQLGAQVQVRAQANAELSCSEGTMAITPNESN